MKHNTKTTEWRWWEVHLADKRLDSILLNKTALVLTAEIESLSLEDLEYDETDGAVEIVHFIESDAFIVVKTVTDEPLDALRRALSLLTPNITGPRKDVQWANIGC